MYRSAPARKIGASCLLLLLAPAALAADRLPRVEVLPFLPAAGVSEDTARRLTGQAREELSRRRDALELTALPADAARLLDQGRRDLAALQLESAKQNLEAGLEAAFASPLEVTSAQLVDAYLALAATELRRGEETGAKRAFAGLLRLAPGFQLPNGRFPPVFGRELEKARRVFASAPRGAITVQGPPGAVAHVDGLAVGRVPVTQGNLAYGRHWVSVELPDAGTTATAVEVHAPEVQVRAPFLWVSQPPLPRVAFVGLLDSRLSGELQARLRRVSSDAAVVATVVPGPRENQTTVISAVYLARENSYRLLGQLTLPLDTPANFSGWGEDLACSLKKPGPQPAVLPHAMLPLVQPSRPSTEPALPAKVALVPVLPATPSPERAPLLSADAPSPVAPSPARVSAPPRVVEALRPEEVKAAAVVTSTEKPLPWWLWVVGGVGVAAVAGGTYYGVSQANRPVTGTVTARW